MHLVERVLLYRTLYVSYLVHSNFIREFFEYLLVLVVNKVPQKVSEFFVVSRYSDAAFHEESEYAFDFEIRKNNCRDFSIFLRKSYQNFSKLKRRRQQNFAFISMKIGIKLKTFFTKMLSERRSTNPESFSKFGRGRRMNLATSYGHTHNALLSMYYSP